ncbi:hypothetical protein [Streptomyces sp. NPDC002265]|uniref:hypothetical protein n=1 Tax=Streptomyces sp. NPDC002265 TaxID=3154415 RepID=UPI003328E5AF
MSRNGRYAPPEPPGPPLPDPDAHRLARWGVRWTVIGVVISTVLAVVGLYQTGRFGGEGTQGGGTTGSSSSAGTATGGRGGASGDGGTSDSGGTSDDGGGTGDGTTGDGGTSDAGSTTDSGGASGDDGSSGDGGADGLTDAQRELRDSLNSDQWSRKSCVPDPSPGAKASLLCTVTTKDEYGIPRTGKATVATYPSKYARDVVFQSFATRVPPGDNCQTQATGSGIWSENDTPDKAGGDFVCFLTDSGQQVILCSYYDRPSLVQITGPDLASLTAWWRTMEPVFTG